jgi:hypothetical protein
MMIESCSLSSHQLNTLLVLMEFFVKMSFQLMKISIFLTSGRINLFLDKLKVLILYNKDGFILRFVLALFLWCIL